MQALQQRVERFAHHYLVALRAFTRLPLHGEGPLIDAPLAADWRRSLVHLPGVGMLVGMAACLVFAVVSLALLHRPFSPFVAAVACLLVTVLMTGGGHEAGLARVADGQPDTEAAGLAADGRAPAVGPLGALALVLSVAARAGLLAVLAAASPAAVITALLAGHVVSRCWPLLQGAPDPHRDPPVGATDSADRTRTHPLLIAVAWAAVPLVLMGLAEGALFPLVAVAGSALAWLGLRQLLRGRGQPTGRDGLGATQQACEAAFYLGAAIGLGS